MSISEKCNKVLREGQAQCPVREYSKSSGRSEQTVRRRPDQPIARQLPFQVRPEPFATLTHLLTALNAGCYRAYRSFHKAYERYSEGLSFVQELHNTRGFIPGALVSITFILLTKSGTGW